MIEKYVESFLSKVEIVHDDLRNRTRMVEDAQFKIPADLTQFNILIPPGSIIKVRNAFMYYTVGVVSNPRKGSNSRSQNVYSKHLLLSYFVEKKEGVRSHILQ